VKVLLITYFALNSLIILVLAIGAVLAYVFREQVSKGLTIFCFYPLVFPFLMLIKLGKI
jgi:hypothetical protein